MAKHNLLLVDDDEENLSTTRSLLQRWGYDVDTVSNGYDAIEYVRVASKEYSVALVDYQMPGKNGADTAAELRGFNSEMVILIYSAYPSVESLKATIRAGVLNFIEKDEDINYFKKSIVEACTQYERVRTAKPSVTATEAEKIIGSVGMAGRSGGLAGAVAQAIKYRPMKKPVLILGETGVGKEFIAKALHSGRSDSFYAVNCAAFENSSLVDSELFGYEKGAFTGAMNRKVGIFEVARGGTVFLDELHHLTLAAQAKLLRAIREKKVRRVGAQQEVDVDFRLIAATRPDIEARVTDKTFLEDLYYRIKFLSIEVPPLRQRPEDIEPIVAHLCERHFKETGERKTFLIRTIRQLEKYYWPGNVGELDGYVSALLANSTKDTIDVGQLDQKFFAVEGTVPAPEVTYSQLEARQDREKREFLKYAIKSSKSLRHAAQKMGLRPSSLHTLLNRLGLRSETNAE